MSFALVKEGKVSSVHHGQSAPKGNYLPLEDDSSVDFTDDTKEITKKARSEWIVESDRVVITYDVEDKNLDDEKTKKLERIKQIRDNNIEKGFLIEINGEEIRFPADDVTIARVDQAALDSERRPDGWEKRWKVDDGFWVQIDSEKIEYIRSTGADFVEDNFKRHEELEKEILQSEDLANLNGIDIQSGWPEQDKT